MREEPDATPQDRADAFGRRIGVLEARKRKARGEGAQGIWLGLGMFGLVGWSVALPTLLGVLLGLFIDKRHPGVHSWTLSLLMVGLFAGCLNAWHWVAKEEKAIRKNGETDEN